MCLVTRKQALHKALETLTDETARVKIKEILDDMPFTGWSERTIFDTIDQFVIDNGRVPYSSDFKKKGLPPHTVIKLRFGIGLKEFLQKYYMPDRLCTSRIYFSKTKEEWMEIFIENYIRNRPRSAEEHNKMRSADTPSWQTISIMFGIDKWLDWLEHCGLEKCYHNGYRPRNTSNQIKLKSHNNLLYELEMSSQ